MMDLDDAALEPITKDEKCALTAKRIIYRAKEKVTFI